MEERLRKQTLLSWISGLLTVLLLFAALFLSSGKTRLLYALLFVGAFGVRLFGKRYRKQILFAFLFLFFLLNAFYNIRSLDTVNDMMKAGTQTLYQEENYVNQTYLDHFLRLLLREHEVKIPYEIRNVEEYMTPSWKEKGGEYFNHQYYKETNYARFLQAYAKGCTVSTDLPDMKATDELAGFLSEFPCIGKSNDMLRYTFLLNEDDVQESSYFWYSWYYYSYLAQKNLEDSYSVYVRSEDFEEDDTLVALWDSAQNLYLMPEKYYEEEVKVNE